jgi:chromosome condensin MukBEF complex kleisin-like MukF subunit
MNKRQVIASLNKIANELDTNGLYSEATSLTKIMKKLAMDSDFDEEGSYRDTVPMEMDDDYDGFNPMQFQKMVEALRDLTMPYGDEEDLVGKLMDDYQVDPTEPSYENLQEVFRDLDDIIEDPRSNIFREQKVRLDGKMVNYDYLKREMLHEAGLV